MSEKIIDEVMGLVQSLRLSEQMQDLEAVGQCEEAIRAKLREVLERKRLTDDQIDALWHFSELSIPQKINRRAIFRTAEVIHNIGAE